MDVEDMVKKEQKMIKKEQDHEDHDKNHGLPVPSTTTTTTTTTTNKNMFACINATAAPAPLTIFYSGTVHVFNGISAEKAQAIMLIAAAAAAAAKTTNTTATNYHCAGAPSPVLTRCPSVQSTSAAIVASPPLQPSSIQNASLCKLQTELPIARRHSLQRFLEKRRDRSASKSPYPPPTPIRAVDDKGTTVSVEASSNSGRAPLL